MLATCDALIGAVSGWGDTKVVASGVPPKSTTEQIVKFPPLTANVKPADPTIAELGARLVTVGPGPGAKTRSGTAADTCAFSWLELSTVTLPSSGGTSMVAPMVAVNCVWDTNVVG